MSALDRYVAIALIKGWMLVSVVILSIFGLLMFVQELEHVGGRYTILQAGLFVIRTLPRLGLDLAPVTGLLGTLIALANLARHSELIAMRASGVSPLRLLLSIMLPASLLSITLLVAAEYAVPVLQQQAEGQRAVFRSGRSSLLSGKGLWSNAGLRFFNVRHLEHGHIPAGIDYYEFEPDGKLKTYAHAERANLDQGREWSLLKVHKKDWNGTHPETRRLEELDMGPFWKKSELPVLTLSTSAMSLSSLYQYARHLKQTHQRSERIELAFWQTLSLPLSLLSMVCLAVPVGAGSTTQRSSDFARRLAIGALTGIAFYLGSQIVHTSGMVLGLPPWLLVSIPILVVAGTAIFLLRRMT